MNTANYIAGIRHQQYTDLAEIAQQVARHAGIEVKVKPKPRTEQDRNRAEYARNLLRADREEL